MDTEKHQKRQSIRVIISELVMVIAVAATVVALAFVVSGYWVNSDFKIERQGMLQVASVPTGADFDVDGESSWLRRTNNSKILSSGEHTVTLTKEGYDSWTKTINISDGLLYRIHYPRLFPVDREIERVLAISNYNFATFSPDGTKLLLGGDTTEWSLVDLTQDTLKPQKINLTNYLLRTNNDSLIGLFNGIVTAANWDRNSDHVLLKITTNEATEWILIDVNNVKNSLNLSAQFAMDFEQVKILNNSASELLVVSSGNLHRANLSNLEISPVIIKNVYSFDHFGNEITFSALDSAGDCIIGLTKIDSDSPVILETISEPTLVNIFKFYDNIYLSTITGTQLVLHDKDEYGTLQRYDLPFAPNIATAGHNGEFITMRLERQIATLDMEAREVVSWMIDGEDFGWLDSDMIYSVADGDLVVYDFDGLNRRAIAKNVSSRFPVAITDDKWLYYFSDGNLIRMQLSVK